MAETVDTVILEESSGFIELSCSEGEESDQEENPTSFFTDLDAPFVNYTEVRLYCTVYPTPYTIPTAVNNSKFILLCDRKWSPCVSPGLMWPSDISLICLFK